VSNPSGLEGQYPVPQPRKTFALPLLLLLILVVSFTKQQALLDQGGPLILFAWLGVLGLFGGALLALGDSAPARTPSLQATPDALARPTARQYRLAAAALLLSLAAAWLVHSGGSATVATVAWGLGLAIILVAAIPPLSWRELYGRQAQWWRGKPACPWGILGLLAVVLIALLLRLPALESIPGYVHNDEASNGLQARAIAEGQVPSLFGYGWANLPLLGYSWDALFFKLLGDSLLSLRLSSAVLGIASVAVLALLGGELFNRRVGVIAGTLLAVSHMAVHFSRVGHHNIHAMFAVTLTVYLLVRAFRASSTLAAVAAGLLLSVDLQVYWGGRVAYVIVPLALLYFLVAGGRERLRQHLLLVAWMFGGWVVGVAPIGAVILGDWASFTARTRDVLVLGGTADTQAHVFSVYGTHDALTILKTQVWRILQTLNFSGDSSEQYGSWHPILDPLSAALLPSAVVYALLRARHPGFCLVLIGMVSALVVGGVLTIDAAFWPRLIVLPPFLALLLAAFLDDLWQALARTRWLLFPATLALLVLLGGIGWGNYQWYFQDFRRHISTNSIAAPMYIGLYLRQFTDQPDVYGITSGDPYIDHQAIQLLAPQARLCNILTGISVATCALPKSRDHIFVITTSRAGAIGQIMALHPGGTLTMIKSFDDGTAIQAYRVVT
jgi:4-amino-4-deoxy-L-arabinose transferase-like glycosyltransferase